MLLLSLFMLIALEHKLLGCMIDGKPPEAGMFCEVAKLLKVILMRPLKLLVCVRVLVTLLILEKHTAGIDMVVLLVE